MAFAKAHKRQAKRTHWFAVVLVVALISLACTLFMAYPAQGSGEVDSSTIGIGDAQSTSTASLSAEERISAANTYSMIPSDAVDAKDSAQRSITVKDPDPVVVPIAIDEGNAQAVEKAKEVCTLDPLPTAPHVAPNLNDGTWSSGVASAYSIADNDDGAGNFNTTATASGRALSDSGITVAVPESQQWRLGQVVEICYDGKVVIATVTDTGGFASYGRALDLAPGVYQAFGASSAHDWGTRTVHYRFL